MQKRLARLARGAAQSLRPPLTLPIDGRAIAFTDARSLAFCLRTRCAVPADRVAALHDRTEAELDAEASRLATVEHRLGELLQASRDGVVALAPALAQVGAAAFSKDHGWRQVFKRFIELGPAYAEEAAIALEGYLAYLAERRDVIGSVALLKSGLAAGPETAAPEPLATSAFDAGSLPTTAPLRRLPQGRAVTLRLACGEETVIRLARHAFALAHGGGWALIAADGERYTLSEGVNSVGRGRDNNVAVDGRYRNVSRRHLLAQPLGADAIALTDVSSCGTWVAPTALAS
ncbi:MAG: hypothetical protein ACU85V_19220 [Gammaproteobacteria bacterium]